MTISFAPNTILQNRYQIERLLGQGGMGAVYRAWDLRLQGRVVAVKENNDVAPESRAQFQTEAALLANLSHPTLPRVTDHFIEASGQQYLVMDYIEGNDLEEIVTRYGRVPEAQAIAWIADVLNGLEYLHTFRPPIIHRDIKPANIKIRSDGKVFLVDFGIAKVFDPTQKTRTGARAVTPGYSPTEQYGFGTTDARSDLYAVGATLYFILTAQVPPEATNLASNLQSLIPPSRFGIPISSQVEQAILRAMAVTPQQRFQSARDFRDALDPARTRHRTLPSQPAQSPNVVLPTAMASPQVAPTAIPQARSLLKPISTPVPIAKPVSAAVPMINVVYASWGRRFFAYLIDSVFLFMITLPVSLFAIVLDAAVASSSGYRGSSSAGVFSTLWNCAGYILIPSYFIVCHSIWGQTLGKKALGIRVMRVSDQHPPHLGWSILRSIAFGIESFSMLCLVGFIGFLWPLWDTQKQAIHDKMAGTIVVRV